MTYKILHKKVQDGTVAVDIRPKDEWISVKDRLPDSELKVLVFGIREDDDEGCDKHLNRVYCARWINKWWRGDTPYGNESFGRVLYWMPIPGGPKDSQDESISKEVPKYTDSSMSIGDIDE